MSENSTRIYNLWWEKYLVATNTDEPGTKYRKNEILKLIKKYKSKNTRILDCGCGAGALVSFLIKNKIRPELIGGCDISDLVIERNKGIFKSVEFFVCNLGVKQDIKKNKYDVVVCSEVIEHVKNWKLLINNLKEFLNPGGIIILSTQSGKRYDHHKELGHLKHFSAHEISEQMEKCDIKILKAYNCGWPFMNLKNILVNLPFLKVRENIMRSGKQSIFNKIQFRMFDIAYMLSSRTKGPQIIVVARSNSKQGNHVRNV